jgi:hypothetical protein
MGKPVPKGNAVLVRAKAASLVGTTTRAILAVK